MKTIIYVVLCLLLSFISLGQTNDMNFTEENSTSPKFVGVENVVEKWNGESSESIVKYICAEIRNSDWAPENKEQGTEIIKFTVDEKGRLSNFKVVNSVSQEIDEELIKILKLTDGKWKPGTKDGQLVAMEKEINLSFICTEKKDCGNYFMMKARKNFDKANQMMIVKNNPKKALKYYNQAVQYCPCQTSSLLLRGICKYELGDKEGAVADWKRINELGNINVDKYINNLVPELAENGNFMQSEAYANMTQVLNK